MGRPDRQAGQDGNHDRAGRESHHVRDRAPAPCTNLSAVPLSDGRGSSDVGEPPYAGTIEYVQHIDVGALQMQACAEKTRAGRDGAARPSPIFGAGNLAVSPIGKAFFIDHDRTYDEDPRFGPIALSEIAGRALSPAVNDPGTAIGTIGTFVRLFALWIAPPDDGKGRSSASCFQGGRVQHSRRHHQIGTFRRLVR